MIKKFQTKYSDFYLFIFFTGLATGASLLSIYLLTLKFGKTSFADLVYYLIFSQIIIALADFGLKNSYFNQLKNHKDYNLLYLVLIKVCISVLLFLVFFLIFRDKLFSSTFFIVVGSSIFPSFLLSDRGLFSIIGLNNFIFRVVPLVFLPLIDSLSQFNLFSGSISVLFALLVIFRSTVRSDFTSLNLKEFKEVFYEVISGNKYLSLINVVNVLEINLHILVSKQMFESSSFSMLIVVDRYVNFIKQGVIYYYEYLFPKISNLNFVYYQNRIRRITRLFALALVMVVIFLYSGYFELSLVHKLLIIVYGFYPLSILAFNFLPAILFLKYCSDEVNLKIVFIVAVIKLVIFSVSVWFGVVVVPVALVFAELFFGVLRYSALSRYKQFYLVRYLNV